MSAAGRETKGAAPRELCSCESLHIGTRHSSLRTALFAQSARQGKGASVAAQGRAAAAASSRALRAR